jgi:IS5 family transposase
LAHEIPLDSIVNVYLNQLNNHATGASNINPRVILGVLMVNHLQNISDEETIQMIRESIYIHYFTGLDSFTSKAPFDSYLFVEIRARKGMEQLNRIKDVIYQARMGIWDAVAERSDDDSGDEKDEDLMSKRKDKLNNDPVDCHERLDEQPNRGACSLMRRPFYRTSPIRQTLDC